MKWAVVLLVLIAVSGCAAVAPAASAPTQPALEYLNNALDWIETHALAHDGMDWQRVRRDALATNPSRSE
jgi:uncharacterized protein YceK